MKQFYNPNPLLSIVVLLFTLLNSSLGQSPGGVSADLRIWLKADDGFTPASWTDHSGVGNTYTQTNASRQPFVAADQYNFNPVIDFGSDASADGRFMVVPSGGPFSANGLSGTFFTTTLTREGGTSGYRDILGFGATTTGAGLTNADIPAVTKLNDDIVLYNSTASAFPGEYPDNELLLTDVSYTVDVQGIHYGLNGRADSTTQTRTTVGSNQANGSVLGSQPQVTNGLIGEVIAFERDLTPQEKQRVRSYLGIKNGVTLREGLDLAYDYLDAAGNIVWAGTAADSNFHNNVFGIANDSPSALHQKQSKSINPNQKLIIGNGASLFDSNAANTNDLADGQFLMVGDNGRKQWLQTPLVYTAGGNGETNFHFEAFWKVQNTGGVGNVTIAWPEGVSNMYLVQSADTTFDNTDNFTPMTNQMTVNGAVYNTATVTLSDGEYFTFAGFAHAPGGVVAGLTQWYRADKNTVSGGDSTTITSWTDFVSGTVSSQINPSAPLPLFRTGSTDYFNFNSGLQFTETDQMIGNITESTLQELEFDIFTLTKEGMSGTRFFNIGRDNTTFSGSNWDSPGLYVNGNIARRNNGGGLAILDDPGNLDFNTDIPSIMYHTFTDESMNKALNGNALLPGNEETHGPVGEIIGGHIFGSNANSGSDAPDGDDAGFTGDIGEVIVYGAGQLTAAQRNKVDTYLALKYGLTLENNNDYVNSADSVIWDATANSDYYNNVAGIANDFLSALDQKQSASVNEGEQVLIGTTGLANTNDDNGTSLTDGQFLLWGDNGEDKSLAASVTGFSTVNTRFASVWKVQNTGSVGTVRVAWPVGVPDIHLIQSADTIFDGSDALTDMSGDTLTINGVDYNYADVTFSDGEYFTFAGFAYAPGGVVGADFWVKSDDAGDIATAWKDHSINADDIPAVGTWALSPADRAHNFHPYTTDYSSSNYFLNTSSVLNPEAGLFSDPMSQAIFSAVRPTSSSTSGRIIGIDDDAAAAEPGVSITSAGLPNHYDFSEGTTNTDFSDPFIIGGGNVFSAIADNSTANGGSSSSEGGEKRLGLNGTYETTTFTSNEFQLAGHNLRIGQSGWTNGGAFPGDIMEIAWYNRLLSPNEQSRVNSYLAIKNGVTLSEDYLDAASNVVWDTTTNIGFNNNIFGLARNNISTLHQKQAASTNLQQKLVIGNGGTLFNTNAGNTNELTEGQFLIVGDNGLKQGLSVPLAYTGGANGEVNFRFESIWKAQNTGSVGSVTVAWPAGIQNMYLVQSPDSTFDDTDNFIPMTTEMTVNSVVYNTATVTLVDGEYFTFAGYGHAPGGVVRALSYWYRADIDADTTGMGADVTSWTDFFSGTVSSQISTAPLPQYQPGSEDYFNFNPGLNFTDDEQMIGNIEVSTLNNVDFDIFTFTKEGMSGTRYFNVGRDNTTFNSSNWDSPGLYANGNIATRNNTGGGTVVDNPGNIDFDANIPSIMYHTFTDTEMSKGLNGDGTGNIRALSSRGQMEGGHIFGSNRGPTPPGGDDWGFVGHIGETIVYGGDTLTTTERRRVDSYLAIKYGITLARVETDHYLASTQSDSLIVWNGQENTAFNNNIFGMARSDIAGFEQKVSRSVNSGTILTVAKDNDFELGNLDTSRTSLPADEGYLLFGDNNDVSTTPYTPTDIGDCGELLGAETGFMLIPREWLVQRTKTTGSTYLEADLSSYAGVMNSNITMFVADDEDFTNNVVMVPGAQSDVGDWVFSYNFDGDSENRYITFGGTYEAAPCEQCIGSTYTLRTGHEWNDNETAWENQINNEKSDILLGVDAEGDSLYANMYADYSADPTIEYWPERNPRRYGGRWTRARRYDNTELESSHSIGLSQPMKASFQISNINTYQDNKNNFEVVGYCNGSVVIPELTYAYNTSYHTFEINGNTAEATLSWRGFTPNVSTANVRFNRAVDSIVIISSVERVNMSNTLRSVLYSDITLECAEVFEPTPDNVYVSHSFTQSTLATCGGETTMRIKVTNNNICEDKIIDLHQVLPTGLEYVPGSFNGTQLPGGGIGGATLNYSGSNFDLSGLTLPQGEHWMYVDVANPEVAGTHPTDFTFEVTNGVDPMHTYESSIVDLNYYEGAPVPPAPLLSQTIKEVEDGSISCGQNNMVITYRMKIENTDSNPITGAEIYQPFDYDQVIDSVIFVTGEDEEGVISGTYPLDGNAMPIEPVGNTVFNLVDATIPVGVSYIDVIVDVGNSYDIQEVDSLGLSATFLVGVDPSGECAESDESKSNEVILPACSDGVIAVNDTVQTNADTPLDIAVLENDIPGVSTIDTSSVAVVQVPVNGTTLENPDGTIEYTPDMGFVGTDSLVYEVCDSASFCDTAFVLITVFPAQDTLPETSTPMDMPVVVCADTTGVPGTVASVTSCTPMNGSVTEDGLTGCIEYTPGPGYIGTDTTCIIVCDEDGVCDTTLVSIIVLPPQDTLPETSTPIDMPVVVCADTTMLSGAITSVETCDPANGTAVADGLTGCIEYTPDMSYIGTDTTCIIVCDENGICDTTLVPIVVAQGVPLFGDCDNITTFDEDNENWRVATTSNGTTVELSPQSIGWTATEGNPGGALREEDLDGNWTEIWTPELTANGYSTDYSFMIGDSIQFDYKNNTGVDYDIYVAIEGSNGVRYYYNFAPQITNSTEWTRVVVPVMASEWLDGFDNNNGPTGSAPSAIDFEGVLSDVDHFAISIEGQLGNDISLLDNFGKACPDLIAVNDTVQTTMEAPVDIAVLENDTPGFNPIDTSSVAVVEMPMNGSTVVNPDGTIEYTPDMGFVGTDSLVYEVCDTASLCDTAIVSITVLPPQDTLPETSTPMDVPVVVCADTAGVPGTVASVTSCTPMNGSVTEDGLTGCIEYTPGPGYIGTDTTCIIVCDEDGVCDTTFVPIIVLPPQDTLPETSTPMDMPVVVCADTTMLSGAITSVETCDPANGTAVADGLTGCIEYTPDMSYTGTDTTCIIVCDENGICDTTFVPIVVAQGVPLFGDCGNITTFDEDNENWRVATTSNGTTVELSPQSIGWTATEGNPGGALREEDLDGNWTEIWTPELTANGYSTDYSFMIGDSIQFDYKNNTGVDYDIYVAIEGSNGVRYYYNFAPQITNSTEWTRVVVPVTASEWLDGFDNNNGPTGSAPSAIDFEGVLSDVDHFAISIEGQLGNDISLLDNFGKACPDLIAVNDTVQTTMEAPVDIAVLENDTPGLNPIDTSSVAVVEMPMNGSTVVNPDGTIEYTPDMGFVGTDSLVYEVCDTASLCDTAIVSITVLPPQDTLPETSVPQDSTVVICADTTGLPGTVASVESCDPDNGTAAVDGLTGCIEYTPDMGYTGTDTTCIIVCDDLGNCDTTIVPIIVYPPQDTLDDVTVPQDSTVVVCADTTALPGTVASVESCDPDNGTAAVDGLTGCIEYTPNSGYTGTDTTCIVVCDDLGNCDTTIVPIIVYPPQDTLPETSVPQDSTVVVCADTTGLPGTVASVESCDPDNGTATVDGLTGCIEYTPDMGYTGTDTTCIIVCDDLGNCDTTIVPIIVYPPQDTLDDVSVPQDSTVVVCADTTGLPGTVASVESCDPDNGTAAVDGLTGCIGYTPNSGYTGTDTTCIIVCDDLGNCDTTIVPVIIYPPQDTLDDVSVPQDSTVVICADTTGLPGTVASVESCDPENGTAAVDGLTGCIEYTPDMGYAGTDTTCIIVCDDLGNCDTTIVPVIIYPPQDTLDDVSVPQDSTVVICADTTGLPGTVASVESCDPENGTAAVDGLTGCIEYTPDMGYTGTDTTCIIVCDDLGNCDTTIVPVIIYPPQDTIEDVSVPQDSTVVICADTTGLPGTVASVESCDPENGTAAVDGLTGCIEYTPDMGYTGTDTTCIIVCDDLGNCDTTIVPVIVYPPQDTIEDVTVPQDSTVVICADTTGLPGTVVSVESCDPENGTAAVDGLTGCIEYTPDMGYTGTDTTCIIVCDDLGNCDTTIIPILIEDIPLVANDDMESTSVNTPVEVAVLDNDTGPIDSTSVVVLDPPSNGMASVNPDGTITYTPDMGFVGNDTLTYVIDNIAGDASDTALVVIEVMEEVEPGPFSCRSFISPAILDGGMLQVTVGDLAASNGENVYTVQVFNEWGAELWSGENLSNFDYILEDIDVCDYLGSTLTVRISNRFGSCESNLILDDTVSPILTSAFGTTMDEASDLGIPTARIDTGLLVTYCGYVPAPEDHEPSLTIPCSSLNTRSSSRAYSVKAQPDWVEVVPCNEESDTSEVIYRTWEVLNKDGDLFTLTDTIVVLRLPMLTAESFVGYMEDTTFCEIEPLEEEGESVKRYAAWKQPLGIHDYEEAYSKLGGVVYELPATVVGAGLLNAFFQGEEVWEEYLECVILKKADGEEITIGDIVGDVGGSPFDTDYWEYLEETTNATQLNYGFLHAIYKLGDLSVSDIVGVTPPLEYFPYLLLEKGDWVLSENGFYEQVTEDWFYNGNANTPYWFAGGWPSIYGSGDCIRYCDVATGEFGSCAVRMLVPELGEGDGEEGCVEICLDELDGNPHCGISIATESQEWAGSCPSTKGQDITVTQTCWANGPGQGAGGVTENECVWEGYDETTTLVDLEESDFESDKRKVAVLSQWLTLIDTIGPIFDFCYPEGTIFDGPNGGIDVIGNAELLDGCEENECGDFQWYHATEAEYEENDNVWPEGSIQAAIVAGAQYPSAQGWEQCNPTVYTTGSHDCAADVYVPSVTLKDDCSGVHHVKAMVNGRAVELDRVSEADGFVTFAHTEDPIRIPFQGHGNPMEVRYEAADSCWNVSEWYKYIEVKDATPPTIAVDDEVRVSLTNKVAWVEAEEFDEGSWDNCGISLRLARRVDWWADTACVDLCSSGKSYDNWVDLLVDVGFSRGEVEAILDGDIYCGDYDYDIEKLHEFFLEHEEVEAHYYEKLKWLWEDGQECGPMVVHGWLYDIARYVAENCGGTDEHGNPLDLEDLEGFFDRLVGVAGYGKEIAYLGGGWSKAVPFKCEDACEEPMVELLVMDYWCNWGKAWVLVDVEDKSQAEVSKELEDITISCEAYNLFYKDVVEEAAGYNAAGGSIADTSDAYAALDEAFGRYIKTWVNNQGQPTDIEGNVLPDSVLQFYYSTVVCEEKSITEKVADTLHDGRIDWITEVTKESYLDTIREQGYHGVIAVNCSATCEQDVWIDLDDCGYGTITRRFFIQGGCGPHGTPPQEVEQVIYVEPACDVRLSMFDVPEDVGTKTEALCVASEDMVYNLPTSLTGNATLLPHLEGALCNAVAIGHEDKVSRILDASGMYKVERTWDFVDWCDQNSRIAYVQEIIVQVDPECTEPDVVSRGPDPMDDFEVGNREIGDGFKLHQNRPNPFDGYTVISFDLPEDTDARLTIYDVTGKVLKEFEGEYVKGYNEVQVAQHELPVTGVMYYQLDTENFTATKRMVKVE